MLSQRHYDLQEAKFLRYGCEFELGEGVQGAGGVESRATLVGMQNEKIFKRKKRN